MVCKRSSNSATACGCPAKGSFPNGSARSGDIARSGRPKGQALAGWTLAEVLLSMGIVLTLTGTVGIAGVHQIERARALAADRQIETLHMALSAYSADCGRYPTSEQGLAALHTRPLLAPVPERWNGPYLAREITHDPWGERYDYHGGAARYELSTEGRRR